jgi:hypothetical protein
MARASEWPAGSHNPQDFFLNVGLGLVDNHDRSERMKVDSIALPAVPNTQPVEMQVINVDAIKTILYLGIKGEIKLETGNKHTVDTYA